MPSKSKSQQRFMGMVRAAQRGETPASAKVAKVAKSIGKGDAEDFASTKHKGLPNKVKKETKVRELIRKMVREIMSEGKFKTLTMPNDMKTKVKVSKIIKKLYPECFILLLSIIHFFEQNLLEHFRNPTFKMLLPHIKQSLSFLI